MSNTETIITRVITVRLRIPALVLACVILVGALVWAFVLGIMVGRGQVNDQIAALNKPEQTEAEEQRTDGKADDIATLIKAEDLKFQESLRQNQPPSSAAELAEAARNDSAPVQPERANTRQQTAAQTRPDTTASQSAAGKQYLYTYQVASYSKEEQAKDLQAKLKAKGVDSSIEAGVVQGASRYRVLISFKGDDAAVSRVHDMLKKDFKITGTLQRGKTPIN